LIRESRTPVTGNGIHGTRSRFDNLQEPLDGRAEIIDDTIVIADAADPLELPGCIAQSRNPAVKARAMQAMGRIMQAGGIACLQCLSQADRRVVERTAEYPEQLPCNLRATAGPPQGVIRVGQWGRGWLRSVGHHVACDRNAAAKHGSGGQSSRNSILTPATSMTASFNSGTASLVTGLPLTAG